ncbi:MAG: hypothetical protein MUC83_15295 [Pirellula sp.]|jgi:hypothetical protein|nr:hypothetical protein [Pirellula sp.]
MKSGRKNIASQLASQQWVKPKSLKEESARLVQKLNREEDSFVETIFFLLAYYNWGFTFDGNSPASLQSKFEPAVPKSFATESKLEWATSLGATAQLVASLSPNESLLRRFCEDMSLDCHDNFGHDLDIQPILFRIANLVRKKPFKDLSKIDEITTKARRKVPQKLCEAIEAIRAKDAKATFKNLNSAIGEHVKHVKLRMAKGECSRQDIIARCHSTVWNLAVLRGMDAPELPEEYLPFMLTRKTLDLD